MRVDRSFPPGHGGGRWLDERHERAKGGRAGVTKTDCEESASGERRAWSQQRREIDAAERARTWRGQSVKREREKGGGRREMQTKDEDEDSA